MNEAHIHLFVNHVPILFTLAGLIVLVTGMVTKSESVKRTSYLFFFIAAIFAMFAMASGEEAEEIVENISGIEKSFIETHEEAAEIFSKVLYLLGLLSLFGLWASQKEKSFSKTVYLLVLIIGLAAMYFAKKTGTSGGEIRHTEIRSDFVAPATDKD